MAGEADRSGSGMDLLAASTGDQYLTFVLNNEYYGVDILKVQGVQGWQSVTEIPNMPAFVLGVMNMRGDVVPIVDLRRRFNLGEAAFTERTVVIIVRVECPDHARTVGLVVDAVSEVHNVRPEDFRKAPEIGGQIGADFLKGLGMVGERMVILFDVDRLIIHGVMAAVGLDTREAAA
jgi:purine-binding chemotaxis protein CheW